MVDTSRQVCTNHDKIISSSGKVTYHWKTGKWPIELSNKQTNLFNEVWLYEKNHIEVTLKCDHTKKTSRKLISDVTTPNRNRYQGYKWRSRWTVESGQFANRNTMPVTQRSCLLQTCYNLHWNCNISLCTSAMPTLIARLRTFAQLVRSKKLWH